MKAVAFAATCVAVLAVSIAAAQEPSPEFLKPQKEHEWLQQFVGEWDSESEGSTGPDQPAVKCKGTMSAKMLGEFWVLSESKTDFMGTPMHALQTLGYDPQKKKYVGSWVDSMLNYMWKYEGALDPTGKVLTFEAEGPNFMAGGKLSKFRDVYEFKSKDHFVVKSSMQTSDGKWVTFMTGNVRRKK